MKRHIIISTLLFFTSFEILAQSNFPPVYEIKNDTAYLSILPDSCWSVLADTGGHWTIKEVSKMPLLGKFESPGLQSIDSSFHTYWFRYRLKNVMDKATNIALDSKADQSDFYVFRDHEKTEHFVTGDLYPWNEKDGFKQGNFIPVEIDAHQEVLVFYRAFNYKTGLHNNFSIDFVDSEKEVRKEFAALNISRNDYYEALNLQEAFIIGLLFLTIFFNLFFYSVVHEKVNIYFALYSFFLAINRLWNITYSYFSWEYPHLVDYVYYLGYAWAFIHFFLILFIREFLQTKVFYRKWDRLLYSLAIIRIAISAIWFLSSLYPGNRLFPVINFIARSLYFIVPFCILITLFLYIRQKNKLNHLFVAGAFPLMVFYFIGSIMEVYGSQLIFPFSDFITSNFRLIETIGLIWLILLFSWTLFIRYNNLRKKSAQQALDNERLAKEKEIERSQIIEQQKGELERQVTQRTAELKHSLDELKSTQSQLIQAEKMASLGQLTAGIAHEIQNPLNFVNNFSEVNKELVDELGQEADKGNIDEIKAIAKNIRENEEKIIHHGKRADAIVKGMLQHSRTNTGQKEPTDINALADEYLRLAYHGLRAKDKTFNAKLGTDFDNSIGKINVIPQDIGRVLVNLINNAFYAVSAKASDLGKTLPGKLATADSRYEPAVTISTKKLNDKVEIRVQDNGNGIPQKILDKIFQPFFTTKPTGQGTGLGLSLSYDIVKAHGGDVRVETVEGEFSEFIIILPKT